VEIAVGTLRLAERHLDVNAEAHTIFIAAISARGFRSERILPEKYAATPLVIAIVVNTQCGGAFMKNTAERSRLVTATSE
jgi:hypothetical protein